MELDCFCLSNTFHCHIFHIFDWYCSVTSRFVFTCLSDCTGRLSLLSLRGRPSEYHLHVAGKNQILYRVLVHTLFLLSVSGATFPPSQQHVAQVETPCDSLFWVKVISFSSFLIFLIFSDLFSCFTQFHIHQSLWAHCSCQISVSRQQTWIKIFLNLFSIFKHGKWGMRQEEQVQFTPESICCLCGNKNCMWWLVYKDDDMSIWENVFR